MLNIQMSSPKIVTSALLPSLQYEPKKDYKGILRTPGATEFFRIMNEEIQVLSYMFTIFLHLFHHVHNITSLLGSV